MTLLVCCQGPVPYHDAHTLQERLIDARHRGEVPDTILLLTHPPTITVGRHRGQANGVVAADDVDVVEVERGGKATWHAPGQLVAYPIIQLQGDDRDLLRALHHIEDAVIDVIGNLDVASSPGRDPRNTGVWIGGKKVCSIGIACRRWVIWHGLALNVDIDLQGFSHIQPCGFDATIMTRLVDHVANCPAVEDLFEPMGSALVARFSCDPPVTCAVSLKDVRSDDIVQRLARVAGTQGLP